MKVRLVDLQAQYAQLKPAIDEAVHRVLASTHDRCDQESVTPECNEAANLRCLVCP